MAMIDLDKTKAAYDFLAETPKGQATLQQLKEAFDKMQAAIQPTLNRGEFLFVLRGLVSHLHIEEVSMVPAEVSGYAASDVQGLIFQGQPGAVTRVASGITSPAFNRLLPSGFKVAIVQ